MRSITPILLLAVSLTTTAATSSLPVNTVAPPQPAAAPLTGPARSVGALELLDAAGSTIGNSTGAFIAPDLFIAVLETVDLAHAARVTTPCCGTFDVEGIVAADEPRNLVLLRVTVPAGQSITPLAIAQATPAPGDHVTVPLMVMGTGVLLLGSKVMTVANWPTCGTLIQAAAGYNPRIGSAPMLDTHGRLCAMIVGSAGNDRPIAAVVPPDALAPGDLIPLPAAAAAQPSSLALARRLLHQGINADDPDETLELLTRATELEPDLWRAHWWRGVTLDQLGRPEESLPHFARARELAPLFSEAAYSAGLVNLKLGRTEPALEGLDRAVALDPGYANAHGMRAVALFQSGQTDAAVTASNAAISADPKDRTHYQNLVAILEQAGRPDAIPPVWRRYCEAVPDDADGWTSLGSALIDAEDPAGAITALRRATETDPNHLRAHLLLAYSLATSGDLEAAKAAADRALTIAPNNRTAKELHNLITTSLPPHPTPK